MSDPRCRDCGCKLRDGEGKHGTCQSCVIGEYDYDEGIPCPKCQRSGEVPCHCGGDLCFCDNMGDAPCPVCLGEGYVTEEREKAYLAAERENAKWLSKVWAETNQEAS